MDREKRMTEGAELEFTFGRASGSRKRMPSTKQEFALKGPSIKYVTLEGVQEGAV